MVDENSSLATSEDADSSLTPQRDRATTSQGVQPASPSAARRRWKLLCLVKTSDFVADETARKEKLQERVDEWMHSVVWKLQEDEDDQADKKQKGKKKARTNLGPKFYSLPNGSKNYLETSVTVNATAGNSPRNLEREKERRRIEREQELAQLERIKQRELAERDKERELILSGRMKFDEGHFKDDHVLKLQRDLHEVQRKASKVQPQRRFKKLSTQSNCGASTGIKMKWISALGRMKSNDHKDLGNQPVSCQNDPPVEQETDTVVANLVYDEDCDRILPLVEEANLSAAHPNPIFKAFDEAMGVDDLYRIAEIWVNPPRTFFGPKS